MMRVPSREFSLVVANENPVVEKDGRGMLVGVTVPCYDWREAADVRRIYEGRPVNDNQSRSPVSPPRLHPF